MRVTRVARLGRGRGSSEGGQGGYELLYISLHFCCQLVAFHHFVLPTILGVFDFLASKIASRLVKHIIHIEDEK